MKQSSLIKENSLVKELQKIVEKLVQLFPDWATGNSEIMKKKYTMRSGRRDHSDLIKQIKIRNMNRYLIILLFFTILIVASIVELMTEKEELSSLQRPESGTKTVPVEANLRYKGYEFNENLILSVSQKELGREEKLKVLRSYEAALGTAILGENKDSNHINQALNLVDRDQEYGITIKWTSTRPELIDENGEVDLFSATDSQSVSLQADLSLDDVTLTVFYPLKIDTDAGASEYKRSISNRLADYITEAERSNISSEMQLSKNLGDGIEVRWFEKRENNVGLLMFIFIILILIVFFKRYDQIDTEVKAAEDSIIRDLPEFINKLVLLLNAGLVVSTAFSKIVEDYESFQGASKSEKKRGRDKRYLYEELSDIQKRIDQSNVSLIKELREFSQRSGVREMVRLTSVISDNWNKGSALAEKLEGEGELLWITRKRKAEERGKLAETKLTFPLMILLVVLIMVTIAPAMLEM